MPTPKPRIRFITVTATTLLLAGVARGGDVDMFLTPIDGLVEECAIVEINLVVSSNDAADQPFDALDAILSWDPGVLQLLGIDDSNAGAAFFVSAFLPDPDGINDDVLDGEALYTALAPAGSPVDAPGAPGELIVTTFVFQTLVDSASTVLEYIPAVGKFGLTRVLFEGGTVTGNIDDDAPVQIGSCPGDVDADGDIDFQDLLRVLAAWGPCDPCCSEDQNDNDEVEFQDLLIVLSQWGLCP